MNAEKQKASYFLTINKQKMKKIISIAMIALSFASCTKDSKPATGKDINSAEKVSVDRFNSTTGHLMIRTNTNGLPAANAPINCDVDPFITKGLSPTGASTEYYNFDVQPTMPADIYVFFKSGSNNPVAGQNNVVNVIPGDAGYNDFWIVNKVTVPDDYVPNSLTSLSEILASGYNIQKTNAIVNCPVVPFGSTASKKFGGGSQTLTLGWYKGKAVAYFDFEEKMLTATNTGEVPVIPIYVMFNDNNAGPASGFKVETGTTQTHNVLSAIPANAGYSPLWKVVVLDNSAFNTVNNFTTASTAPVLVPNAGLVNCPVVN
jgi:hypothetical protein